MNTTKKFTMSSLKSWIKKNAKTLQVREISSFDGMCDCVMPVNGNFTKVASVNFDDKHSFGISGAWFVGESRDRLHPKYENGQVTEVAVYNCCGTFVLKV